MLNKLNNEFFFRGKYLILALKYSTVVIVFIADSFVTRVSYLHSTQKRGIVTCKRRHAKHETFVSVLVGKSFKVYCC